MWQKDSWGGWYLAGQECIGSMEKSTAVWNKDDSTGEWYLAGKVLKVEVPGNPQYQMAV